MCELVKQSIESTIQQTSVRQCAVQALTEMLQGAGISFAILKGGLSLLARTPARRSPGRSPGRCTRRALRRLARALIAGPCRASLASQARCSR